MPPSVTRSPSLTGYLPGDLRLWPGLRGHETIDLIASLRTRPIDPTYVHNLADRLTIDLNMRTRSYPKGSRQNLGIILALLDRPPVLLLDEPTSGLDPLVQRVVWEILGTA